ncbi:MAG: nitrogen regulation protein NR(II) [Pyrinomonadaceae bacterium]
MFSLNEKYRAANLRQMSVQTLVLGRLVVIFLLLVVAWIWVSGRLTLSLETFPQSIFIAFIVSVGLTIVYFFLLRLSSGLGWQVRLQFSLDALLITWLVWRTGDLSSPFIVLYLILISVSSLFLRSFGTVVMAFICIILFSTLSVLTGTGMIESKGPELALARMIQGISFHVVAFLVVGLLAARLADRSKSSETLEETTRKLADLRVLHERIIESIRSGLITTDLEGKIYTFNSAATEITGYRIEDMVGRSISRLFGDISQEIEQSIVAAAQGEQLPRFEATLSSPEGFAVRIGYGISQLLSETNEQTGYIITFQDLTEIRSMEESVRRKDRLAAVGRVGAGLAHEIRNPLGAMRGAIQVLEANTPAESLQADLMGIILRESDRLNSIITNFLSYARPKVGNFTEIDIGEAIRETLTLLRHSPDVSADHTLEEVLPPQPVFISADSTQIKQIFWNLARNSIQAMKNGGRLKIRLETIGRSRIRIIFEDTGDGMPPERVEQLFEPFAKSTSGGTGLGLSIVYQIIRDHNGSINVRSIEGEGTTITVELPAENRPREVIDDETDVDGSDDGQNKLQELLNVRDPAEKLST